MRNCTQCGKCCTFPSFMLNMEAHGEDVLRWAKEGRKDILDYVVMAKYDDAKPVAELWFDPNTKERLPSCPFVKKQENNTYHCSIYETRPKICKGYPYHLAHMVGINCEMLEVDDYISYMLEVAEQHQLLAIDDEIQEKLKNCMNPSWPDKKPIVG